MQTEKGIRIDKQAYNNLINLLLKEIRPGDDQVLLERIDWFSREMAALYRKVIQVEPDRAQYHFGQITRLLIDFINKFNSDHLLFRKDAITIALEIIGGYIESLLVFPNINYRTLTVYVKNALKAFLKFENYELLNEYLIGTAKFKQAKNFEFILQILMNLVSDDPVKINLARSLFDPEAFGGELPDIDEEDGLNDLEKAFILHLALNTDKNYSEKEVFRLLSNFRLQNSDSSANYDTNVNLGDSEDNEDSTVVFN